ncbi:F-box/WD repeat-containing protein 4 isoform X2 [Protopterus annectens]|uniref:F-box/WD repeat-containing protein 4 isoform X2 n=1 Tax=Protopterus annectens TaxID=7888 RepID=UPI001CFBE6DB|nr:F-box/WD repeat-containing protein 4 isoform X2 [Protopterus annectens]
MTQPAKRRLNSTRTKEKGSRINKGRTKARYSQGPKNRPFPVMTHFLELPDDIIFVICSYLDTKALCRLSQTCLRLHHLTNYDSAWRRIAKKCLNTGITHDGLDLFPNISLKDRVKVSQNWKRGLYREDAPLKWKKNLLPWIQLDGDILYLSQAADIRAFKLQPEKYSLKRKPLVVYTGHREDVCRFLLTSSHIISGGGDGKIILHQKLSNFKIEFSAHEQEVNCIDCLGGVILSGSRDKTARVWSLSSNTLGQCLHTIPTGDRVWSAAISPILSSFATGTACCGHVSPLRIWDLERGELLTCLGEDFRRGAGILDILYETPFTLFSCGYDTYIRYWDTRVSTTKCMVEWEEPHDSALYCIQTDRNNMIASGSAYYGVVRLWDKRQSYCLQTFYLSVPVSSPVYCLRFTTSHLYAALSSALHVLDFKSVEPHHS